MPFGYPSRVGHAPKRSTFHMPPAMGGPKDCRRMLQNAQVWVRRDPNIFGCTSFVTASGGPDPAVWAAGSFGTVSCSSGVPPPRAGCGPVSVSQAPPNGLGMDFGTYDAPFQVRRNNILFMAVCGGIVTREHGTSGAYPWTLTSQLVLIPLRPVNHRLLAKSAPRWECLPCAHATTEWAKFGLWALRLA